MSGPEVQSNHHSEGPQENRKNYENMAASVFKAFEDEIIKVSEFLPFNLKDASNAHDTLESRKGGGSIYLVP